MTLDLASDVPRQERSFKIKIVYLESARKTGKVPSMRELYREGVATHSGPESTGGGNNAAGEALRGVHAAQVLSREILPLSRVKKSAQDAEAFGILARKEEEYGRFIWQFGLQKENLIKCDKVIFVLEVSPNDRMTGGPANRDSTSFQRR